MIPFNNDLTIITGRNGSGKTSALKLLWYILSGNILLALREVPFRRATLLTDTYSCAITRLSRQTCRVEWSADGKTEVFEDAEDDDGNVFFNAEDEPSVRLEATGASVFFPTFRRIEGGFSISSRSDIVSRTRGDIEDAFNTLSKKLSKGNHSFVSSISTVDIVGLLMRHYNELSDKSNQLQANTSQEIIEQIKHRESDQASDNMLEAANRLLDKIRQNIENMESERERIMAPLEAVRELAMRLLRHSGIKLGRSLSFGDAAGAVNSEELSAGEKQMLSFISYNAFFQDAIMIIDEPELSLHVDWQRQLFPMLLAQQASNQFIIATHSPFIYSHYPDKEIMIDQDRGNSEDC